MSARSRTFFWILTAFVTFGWWSVAGLFAFGVIGPVDDPAAMWLFFTACGSIGGSVAVATYPSSTS